MFIFGWFRRSLKKKIVKEQFEKIHVAIENSKESAYKGIQLYFSPLHESEILFIGINPGAGYFNYTKELVKRFKPLRTFEYVGQKYYLATQTKKIFIELGLEKVFYKSIKINHFPFATKDERDLNMLLAKYNDDHKIYYFSKQFVQKTIDIVKPKLIICEGKSSFDRLKSILNLETLEYNENTYVMKDDECIIIGYKRHLSYIKSKDEFKSKIKKYFKSSK